MLILYNRVWEQLQNSDLPPPKAEIGHWEARFNELANSERDEGQAYGDMMQNAWNDDLRSFMDNTEPSVKFDEEGLPLLGEYVFGMYPSRSLLNRDVWLTDYVSRVE